MSSFFPRPIFPPTMIKTFLPKNSPCFLLNYWFYHFRIASFTISLYFLEFNKIYLNSTLFWRDSFLLWNYIKYNLFSTIIIIIIIFFSLEYYSTNEKKICKIIITILLDLSGFLLIFGLTSKITWTIQCNLLTSNNVIRGQKAVPNAVDIVQNVGKSSYNIELKSFQSPSIQESNNWSTLSIISCFFSSSLKNLGIEKFSIVFFFLIAVSRL